MQTFLPEADIILSLERLDRNRLGKQRVEAYQLIRTIEGKSKGKGWVNHPATNMWREHVPALKFYHDMACYEWMCRGYQNNMELYKVSEDKVELPHWFGNQAFHDSHKSNLIRKLPSHYQAFWPSISADLPYLWPTSTSEFIRGPEPTNSKASP